LRYAQCALRLSGRIMAEVKLERVAKSYGKEPLFRDLSLTVRDGECFTLLGPSGCGKTVILRLIAGFEQPDSGEISIGDRLVSSTTKKIHLPPEERKIGVVFQDYAVWPHKTVFDNVIYPLRIQGVPKHEAPRRTEQVIEQVNLKGLERRFPYQLSGGQQQRVALARALVSKPEIMLLDEPLSNLDANLREEMRFEIKALQENTGVTILYVTHDQEVALAISDRMAIMDRKGLIRQIGAPDEIYENPSDTFVFKFMGLSNFLPLELRDSRAFVRETQMAIDVHLPEGVKGERDWVIGCRPSDIDLSRGATGADAVVRKVVLLGASIDYRIELGNQEVRVQKDTREAIASGLLFSEGDPCVLKWNHVKWFEPQKFERED